MNVMLFMSAQTGTHGPIMGSKLIETAAASLIDQPPEEDGVHLGVAMSTDEEGGWSLMGNIQQTPQDAIVFFGKTALSAGLDDLPEFTVRKILLGDSPSPVKVVRLPSMLSSVWSNEGTQDSALGALRNVLQADLLPPTHSARTTPGWN